MKIKFLRTRQVGMTGPRSEQFFRGRIVFGIGFDSENLFPICPVAILDAQSYQCADGLPMALGGENVGAVFFYFVPPPSSVPELATVQFAIDEFEVHRKRGRQT